VKVESKGEVAYKKEEGNPGLDDCQNEQHVTAFETICSQRHVRSTAGGGGRGQPCESGGNSSVGVSRVLEKKKRERWLNAGKVHKTAKNIRIGSKLSSEKKRRKEGIKCEMGESKQEWRRYFNLLSGNHPRSYKELRLVERLSCKGKEADRQKQTKQIREEKMNIRSDWFEGHWVTNDGGLTMKKS